MTGSAERRASLAAALEGVDGWRAADEAWALHAAVLAHPAGGPISVVEIGSWKGRSTIALASAVAARPAGGVVHAIDPHRGGVAHRLRGEEDSFDAFLANLEGAGVRDVVDAIRATSADARDRVADDSVHVLFLNGSHRFEDVLHDVAAWEPALRPGARVALHDAVAHPGVRAAVRERVLARGSRYRSPRLVQETLFVDYSPAAPWRPADSRRAIAMRGRIAAVAAGRRATSAVRRLTTR